MRSYALLIALAVLLATAVPGAPAQAITIFEETFDGYSAFPDEVPRHDPVNLGVPLISEGASENWFAARFGKPETSFDCDLAVQAHGGSGNDTPVGRFEDQAGLLFAVDTTGLTDVVLSFDWRTFDAPAGDQSVVGYYISESPPFETDRRSGWKGYDGPKGGYDDDYDDEYDHKGGYDDKGGYGDKGHGKGCHDDRCSDIPSVDPDLFTELLRVDVHGDFTHHEFALPGDVGTIWIAFWHDGGEADYTKLDNVRVTANSIPEPSAALLLLLGSAGLAAFGRKRV